MSGVVPARFRESGVEEVMQDMTSATLPGGHVMMPPLAAAAGVMHVGARIVVLPDDARLVEFREEYAGRVGTFMRFPTDGFAGSTEVIGSGDFLELRRAGPEGLPDSRVFLRARLLDLLVGDWDRHHDQWRWARFADRERLQPIPEDRDQAFSDYDGMAMDVVRLYGGQMVELREDYASMERMVRNGADHDRQILNDIEREEWMAIAREVAEAITDEVIHQAVGQLPEEFRALVGDLLFARISARRDGLVAAAADLYEILNRRVDVHGTDRDELFHLERTAAGEVLLNVALLVDGEPRPPYYSRRLLPRETRELRLYLHGGADRVEVDGPAKRAIRLRAIAGSDLDRVEARPEHAVERHDFADQETWQPALRRSDEEIEDIFTSEDIRVPGASSRDWGASSKPEMIVGYHADPGVVLGFGLDWRSYRFRKEPWGQRHRLRGALATGPEVGMLEYVGDFRRRRGEWSPELLVRLSDLEQLRYYGFGNETPDSFPDLTTRAEVRRFTVYPSMARDIGRHATLSLGPRFDYTDSRETRPDSVLGVEQPYGFGTFGEVGFEAGLDYDSRSSGQLLQKGLQWRAEAAWFPELADVESSYGYLEAAVGWHQSPVRPLLISLYAGGKHVWNDYPFFRAAYLGGQGNAMGYRWNRFAGDASAFGSAQLRWSFTKVKAFIPGEVGLTALGDVGRVFLDGEDSSRWHPTGGLGFFYAAFQRTMLLEMGVTAGREDTFFVVNGGIRFAGLE
jgi:hypothetical protein